MDNRSIIEYTEEGFAGACLPGFGREKQNNPQSDLISPPVFPSPLYSFNFSDCERFT